MHNMERRGKSSPGSPVLPPQSKHRNLPCPRRHDNLPKHRTRAWRGPSSTCAFFFSWSPHALYYIRCEYTYAEITSHPSHSLRPIITLLITQPDELLIHSYLLVHGRLIILGICLTDDPLSVLGQSTSTSAKSHVRQEGLGGAAPREGGGRRTCRLEAREHPRGRGRASPGGRAMAPAAIIISGSKTGRRHGRE